MTNFSGRGVHGSVVETIGARIVDGEMAEGHIIDPEMLEREFGVSRTLVREVIKVLTAKGLTDAKPRLGTYVQPRSHWNLLDRDILRWRERKGPDVALMRQLGEVRQVFEPAGARFAAERRTEQDVERMASALERMRLGTAHEPSAIIDADLEFHRAILSASKNEILEQLEVLLEPAMRARNVIAFRHNHSRTYLASHTAVFDAIEQQRPEVAERAMAALLHEAVQDTARILGDPPV